jgi:rhombotail lipoprotein
MNTLACKALFLLSLAAMGCGAAPHQVAISPAAEAMRAPAPAPVLDRSLFSRDVSGTVSETDLQRMLDARLDLSFPARVGVVTLAEPFRAEAGAPLSQQSIVGADVVHALKGSEHFAQVTNVSTDLPNPQGLEGLRTIAARYRIRYLLLCSVRAENHNHLNNWAWLYPTVLGFFAAPGLTVSSEGMMQASLLDVRTGTVLFTATEPYESSSVTWVIGASRHHDQVDARALHQAASRLAQSVLAQTQNIVQWAAQEGRPARVASQQ